MPNLTSLELRRLSLNQWLLLGNRDLESRLTPRLRSPKLSIIKLISTYYRTAAAVKLMLVISTLGVRNMKLDFNTGGTWHRVGQ